MLPKTSDVLAGVGAKAADQGLTQHLYCKPQSKLAECVGLLRWRWGVPEYPIDAGPADPASACDDGSPKLFLVAQPTQLCWLSACLRPL